jgi:gas vesicle protein
MKNKFKKGLILGGLLAAGAVLGFAMSKDGKKLSEKLQKDLKPLAKHLKINLHKLQDITKESFNKLAATAVEEYAKKKKIAVNDKEALTAALQAKWQEMEEEYLADQVKNKAKNNKINK